MNARAWLLKHGYADVVDRMDKATDKWKSMGRHTRRNWWETLAGGTNGTPRTVYGIDFPVLAVAQERQRLPVTPNAVRRDPNERPPRKTYHGKSLTLRRTKRKSRPRINNQ